MKLKKKDIIMITFKKTLLAVSVLGFASASQGAELSATAVFDAGITAAAPSIQEVATLDAVTITAPNLHLGANYGAGDTITVTYSGASLDEDYSHPTGNLTVGTTTSATCTSTNLAVSFAGLSGSVATYTVGASDGANTGCFLTMPAVNVDGASLASADKFNMAVSTSRGYGVLEAVVATKLVDVAAAEITTTITAGTNLAFDQVVDVNKDRYEFSGSTQSDIAAIVLADAANGATLTATSVMTLTGDFGWAGVSTTTAGVTTVAYGAAQMGVAAATTANLGTVTRTATSMSWIAKAADTYTVTLTPQAKAKKVTLPATTYALSTAMKYTNGTDTAVLTDTVTSAPGAWTLNGASITALGVSNSPSVTPMIWIQNAGSSAGNISGSVNCNGTTITIADLGVAAAKSNTKVGEAIQTAVDDAGTCSTVNTRYDATVTVNGPAADITMNASYKVTAADGATDRVMLETSDSLPLSSVVAQ
jgi:hypothetical protein